MTDAATWDRVWTVDPYRLPRLRAARARSKVAAAIAAGLELTERDRVLDLACGSGHVLIEIVEQTATRPRSVACDVSGVALREARESFRRAGLLIPALRADAESLPIRSRSLDKVLAFMILQHVRDPARALDEIGRVLAADGRAFFVVPCRHSSTSIWHGIRRAVGRSPFGDRRIYAASQWVSLLGDHFVVEAWRPFQSGSDRPFTGAVDRALARVFPFWGRYVVARCRKVRSSVSGAASTRA